MLSTTDLTAWLSATHTVFDDVAKVEKEELVFQHVRPKQLGLKRSDLKFKTVLCSQKSGAPFAVAELENGKFAAVWPGHAFVADTLEGLAKEMNNREHILLSLKAHAG